MQYQKVLNINKYDEEAKRRIASCDVKIKRWNDMNVKTPQVNRTAPQQQQQQQLTTRTEPQQQTIRNTPQQMTPKTTPTQKQITIGNTQHQQLQRTPPQISPRRLSPQRYRSPPRSRSPPRMNKYTRYADTNNRTAYDTRDATAAHRATANRDNTTTYNHNHNHSHNTYSTTRYENSRYESRHTEIRCRSPRKETRYSPSPRNETSYSTTSPGKETRYTSPGKPYPTYNLLRRDQEDGDAKRYLFLYFKCTRFIQGYSGAIHHSLPRNKIPWSLINLASPVLPKRYWILAVEALV